MVLRRREKKKEKPDRDGVEIERTWGAAMLRPYIFVVRLGILSAV